MPGCGARTPASAKGAGRILAQAITTACAAGVRGRILCRAYSAYFGWAFVGTALRHDAWFSVTARMTKTVTAAIASIPAQAWIASVYPAAIYDEAEQRWVPDAEVAEVSCVSFTGRRKTEHVPCRLVVRRVKRFQRLASDGTEQGELIAAYRHHAFITNRDHSTVEADERHRDHAIVEMVIAELNDNALAHLPSGNYAANAAWVACAVIAFNLAPASAVAAGHHRARWATLRRKIITVPARIASTGHRIDLHMPTDWPSDVEWQALWTTATATATGPPSRQRPDHPADQGATEDPKRTRGTARPTTHAPTPTQDHAAAETTTRNLIGGSGLSRRPWGLCRGPTPDGGGDPGEDGGDGSGRGA